MERREFFKIGAVGALVAPILPDIEHAENKINSPSVILEIPSLHPMSVELTWKIWKECGLLLIDNPKT